MIRAYYDASPARRAHCDTTPARMKRKHSDELDATGAAGAGRAKAEKEQVCFRVAILPSFILTNAQKMAISCLPTGTDQIANEAPPVRKGFFDLPREIRDMIYHYIWSDTTSIRQHHAGDVYTVTYGVKSNIVTGMKSANFTRHPECREQSATWLLANKQMLREGLEQLGQKITWHFGPSIHQSQWKIRNSRLITPYKARGYQLQIGLDAHGLMMCFDSAGHFLQDDLYTDTRIPKIIGFTKRTSIVTTLHVDIVRDYVDTELIDQMLKHGRVDFHLWQLEQLSVCTRLRKFSVTLHDDYDDDPYERWARMLFDYKFDPEERYLEGLQKELSRIGRILVGDGKESVMSFRTYMAQFSWLNGGGYARWDYMIEK